MLESPRQAARFVSLLVHEKAPVVGGGGGKQEQWCTLMAFLCRGKVRKASWQPQQGWPHFSDDNALTVLLIVQDRDNGRFIASRTKGPVSW